MSICAQIAVIEQQVQCEIQIIYNVA